MLLLALVWSLALSQLAGDQQATERAEDEARLDRAESMLAERLATTVTDLRFLAQTSELQATLQDRSPASLDRAAALLGQLLLNKNRYAGARLYDSQGTLLIRVDRHGDDIVRAGADLLLRADGREAYDAARALPPGSVHVSRFELHVDGGQIELPHRPLLRAALPLRRPDRQALVLALDQDGQRLLSTLAPVLAERGAEGMLVDDLGYWLYHPDSGLRWGAQVGGGESLERRYPQTWRRMQESRGVILNDEGRWTYRPIYPFVNLPGVSGPIAERGWWLALRHPPQPAWSPQPLVGSWWFWGSQALVLLASLLRARWADVQDRQRRAEAQAQGLSAHDAQVQRQVRDQVYSLSLRIQAAGSAEVFGRLLLSELAPRLKVSVGALYQLDGEWLRVIAGYGLPDDVMLRQFRLGDGLVGKALAERRRIELDVLPPDYLEVRSALGHAAPAHLLIVPLWLRTQNLGVIELGLAAPLDEVAHATLRHSLPLIALHLANYRQQAAGAPA